MEKRPKVKKHCNQRYFERFLDARALKTMQRHAKTSVLDRLYGEKRVDFCVFDGKHCKKTVKNNVLEGFLVSMFELASGTGPWTISGKHCPCPTSPTLHICTPVLSSRLNSKYTRRSFIK